MNSYVKLCAKPNAAANQYQFTRRIGQSDDRLGEGLRMPGHDGGAARTRAGVRKPAREGTAGEMAGRASDAMGISALAVSPGSVQHSCGDQGNDDAGWLADSDRPNRRH